MPTPAILMCYVADFAFCVVFSCVECGVVCCVQVQAPTRLFKVGGQKYSEYLARRGVEPSMLHYPLRATSPPVETPVSESLRGLESLAAAAAAMSEAERAAEVGDRHFTAISTLHRRYSTVVVVVWPMQLWVERLWHQPAVFVLHNFVSAAEAERMIRHAAAVHS